MGLREWILGNYAKRIENVEKRLEKLDHVANRLKVLEAKLAILDLLKDDVKENRLTIREILKDIEAIRLEIEAIRLKSEADLSASQELTDLELEEQVLELIKKGYHSPTELAQLLGISKDRLYKILKRLIKARLIAKIGKGKHTKYVPKEEATAEESG